MELLLEAKKLSKGFDATPVFRDVDITIAAGQNLLIQGPSGCGKTTLLRCLALLEKLDGGEIRFCGKTVSRNTAAPIPDRATRLAISIVFQQLHLWPHMTLIENVALPLELQGLSTREAHERALSMLNKLGLGNKGSLYPIQLSGGQQQRGALARSFVHSPRLLLLDEITSSLDEKNVTAVMSALETIYVSGATLVIVSHRETLPTSLTFRTLKYSDGKWL